MLISKLAVEDLERKIPEVKIKSAEKVKSKSAK